jgi:glucose-1-phosphate adenylyltransferase
MPDADRSRTDPRPLAATRHRAVDADMLETTFAVVLAGGRGERLKQLTDWRAKPDVPFAGRLKIIDFTLSNCVNSGLRRIAVLTQYKAQSLIRHLTQGWNFLDASLGEFIDVVPAQQRIGNAWYSGTADAVFQNLDMLRAAGARHVLVLAGDHVYKMDYGAMLADHLQSGADVSVACLEVPLATASAFGVMRVDADARVLAFDEKPRRPLPLPGHGDCALASMGIYVFDAEFLYRELARDAARGDSCHDFGGNILPQALVSGHVHAHDFRTSCVGSDAQAPYWRDVGTLDAYWRANLDLTGPAPGLDLGDAAWPIRGLPEQLPPARFVFDADGRRGMAVDALGAGGCTVSGATVRRSVLFSRARVNEGSLVEDSLVLPGAVVGRNVVLRRTIVDADCVVPDWIKVGVYPAEDRARFTVTEAGVTLVTAAMFGQVLHAAA